MTFVCISMKLVFFQRSKMRKAKINERNKKKMKLIIVESNKCYKM